MGDFPPFFLFFKVLFQFFLEMIEFLVFLPALFLLWLANLSLKDELAKKLTKVTNGILVILWFLVGILAINSGHAQYGVVIITSCVLASVFFVKFFRQAISRLIPINPDNWLHATVIIISMLLFGAGFGVMATSSQAEIIDSASSSGNAALGVTIQDLILIIASFIGVGWLSRKSFKAATLRLGLKRPTVKEIGISIAFVGVLFMVLVSSSVVSRMFVGDDMGILEVEEDPTAAMLGGISIVTAIFFALLAGISEELLFRGAMQPRLGIIFTSIVFVALHIQYPNLFLLAILFIMSCVYGIERKVAGTIPCIITHVTYDMILLLMVATA